MAQEVLSEDFYCEVGNRASLRGWKVGSIAQGEGASAATATDGGIAIGSVGGDVNLGDKDKPI